MKTESELKTELLEAEIQNLKEERNIRKRWDKIKLISFSLIVLSIIASVAYAATVTKPHTFAKGDKASASEVNANFDTLYNLLNGQLDNDNIKEVSGDKITSGTIPTSRIPDLDASKITTGTLKAAITGAGGMPSGTLIFHKFDKTNHYYQVPSGKTLHIVHAGDSTFYKVNSIIQWTFATRWPNYNDTNWTRIFQGSSLSGNQYITQQSGLFFPEGTIISTAFTASSPYSTHFIGFLY